jgi:glucosamine--fructose-6-phosphate aminotransferase (isomerizing)
MKTNDHNWAHLHTWNEILSQGEVWKTALDTLHRSTAVERIVSTGGDRREWLFVGCGTSFYLAEAAALSWTLLTNLPARGIPASEILLFPGLLSATGGQTQAVVISRSGRTSEAVRAAKVLSEELQIATLGITCAMNSELQQICSESIVLSAADENSTVMTRSFTSMLLCLQFLAAKHAGKPQFIERLQAMADDFAPRIRTIAAEVEAFVRKKMFDDYVFLGQGPFHGIAREAALKVMEMSCSYSQVFHTLEFRHGPKAIVTPATCLTFFLSETAGKEEAEVLSEMKELGGATIAICNRAQEAIRQTSDLVLEMKIDGDELALLAPYTVPCQLMGFFTGLRKGLNPDEPKNLTRVVILD